MRVTRLPRIYSDLREISATIANDNPDAARRFLVAAEHAFQELSRHPDMGPPRNFRSRQLKNLRSWQVPGFRKYLIFYRVSESAVEIVRILHGARDLRRALLTGE